MLIYFCIHQGWSSAYTIEAVIMQIAATLVKGKARIKFDAPKVIQPAEYSNVETTQTDSNICRVLIVWPEHNRPSSLLFTFTKKMVSVSPKSGHV